MAAYAFSSQSAAIQTSVGLTAIHDKVYTEPGNEAKRDMARPHLTYATDARVKTFKKMKTASEVQHKNDPQKAERLILDMLAFSCACARTQRFFAQMLLDLVPVPEGATRLELAAVEAETEVLLTEREPKGTPRRCAHSALCRRICIMSSDERRSRVLTLAVLLQA